MIILAFALLGIIGGFLAGLLGIGGGVIIVPGCVTIFHWLHMPSALWMHMAAGSSLASVIATASSAVRTHHQHQAVLWPITLRLVPGMLIGICLGTYWGHLLSTAMLSKIFGVFLILIAIRMALNILPHPDRSLPSWLGLSIFGSLMGISTGLLGIGGGVLAVPFFIHCNVPMHKATGTSAACTLLIAIFGTINFIWHGWHTVTWPLSTGYIYWPAVLGISLTSVLFAPLGAKWAHRLPINSLKRIFAIFLLGIGLNMLAVE